MSLTQKQIYDLNNMNVASQNVALGTTLNSLIEGSGGDVVKVVRDESMTDAELGEALVEVIEGGKVPIIFSDDRTYWQQLFLTGENYILMSFITFDIGISAKDLTNLIAYGIIVQYENGAWSVIGGGSNIVLKQWQ